MLLPGNRARRAGWATGNLPVTIQLWRCAANFKYFIDQKEEPERTTAYQHLTALTRYAETETCRRVPLLGYFGEDYLTKNCGMCDNCVAGEKEQVDITIPAQKFLSCVRRTGEMFGAVHVADVLLGSENQKVLKFGHQNLSTYGIGKELSRKQWQHLARQLIQKGLLLQDETYGSLRLTPSGSAALKNRETILGRILQDAPTPRISRKTGEPEYDKDLFELLRKKRKELADHAHLPPYIIFSDRTLIEMAAYYPQTTDSLLKINGVGQVKASHYGSQFLEIIQNYCRPRHLDEKTKSSRREAAPPVEKNARHILVAEAYNEGQTVQQLMEHYGVQQNTILDHLVKYAADGNSLRGGNDLLALSTLSPAEQASVFAAFKELGPERLSPIFARFDGKVSYEELKVMRLYSLSKLSK